MRREFRSFGEEKSACNAAPGHIAEFAWNSKKGLTASQNWDSPPSSNQFGTDANWIGKHQTEFHVRQVDLKEVKELQRARPNLDLDSRKRFGEQFRAVTNQ